MLVGKHFLNNNVSFNKMINVGNRSYCLVLSKIVWAGAKLTFRININPGQQYTLFG